MTNLINAICIGYRKIYMVGSRGCKSTCFEQIDVDIKQVKRLTHRDLVRLIIESKKSELVFIDLDDVGNDEVAYLLFLASCFISKVSMVLVTVKQLDEAVRERYLRSRTVLDVIRLDDAASAAIAA